MADGLTRLLAPILSFTADELWRYLPARRLESVHIALFPEQETLEALVDPPLLRAMGAAGRASRAGAGRDRAAPEGQADRQFAPGACRAVGERKGAGVPRELRRPVADAVHRVRGGAAAGADRRGRARRSQSSHHHRARRRREVRAVLALRPNVSSEPEWAGLCDRCQDASPSRFVAEPRAHALSSADGGSRFWLPIVVVALDQLTKWLVRTRVRCTAASRSFPTSWTSLTSGIRAPRSGF